jgi:hypothetical protein
MKNLTLFFIVFALFAFSFSCKKTNTPNPPPPPPVLSTVSILDIKQARDPKFVSSFRFYINVTPSSSSEIKVNYTTKDSTAFSGIDYTTTTGTLTIPANQTLTYVDVNVTGDSLRKADQTFFLELSSPVSATIDGTGKATATIFTH